MAMGNIPISNGSASKLWAAIVTVLATLSVAMFVNWLAGASSAATHAEVSSAITSVRKDAADQDKAIADQLDKMQQKLEDLSIRLEHVDTLLEGGRGRK